MAFVTKNIETLYKSGRTTLESHVVERDGQPLSHKLDVIRTRDAVGILPITDDKKAILIKQYRYPVQEKLLEICAGLIDPFESPSDAAIRECEEETGYSPKRLEKIGEFYSSPGLLTEKIDLFFGFELIKCQQKLEQMEDIEVVEFDLDELLKHIREIRDLKTRLAIETFFNSQYFHELFS